MKLLQIEFAAHIVIHCTVHAMGTGLRVNFNLTLTLTITFKTDSSKSQGFPFLIHGKIITTTKQV